MMIKRNRHGHNPWRLLHHAEGSIPCGSLRLYSAKRPAQDALGEMSAVFASLCDDALLSVCRSTDP